MSCAEREATQSGLGLRGGRSGYLRRVALDFRDHQRHKKDAGTAAGLSLGPFERVFHSQHHLVTVTSQLTWLRGLKAHLHALCPAMYEMTGAERTALSVSVRGSPSLAGSAHLVPQRRPGLPLRSHHGLVAVPEPGAIGGVPAAVSQQQQQQQQQ